MRRFSPWLGLWLAPIVLVVHGYWAARIHASAPLAGAGALIAVLGALTIGRPVIRLGFKRWLAESLSNDSGEIDDNGDLLPKYKELAIQSELDSKAIQVSGPILAIFGTLLNGYSEILTKALGIT